MRKLQYSPSAVERLKEIKRDLTLRYDARTVQKAINQITKAMRGVQTFAYKGPSVESMTGIPCRYRMIYVKPNYIFYTIEEDAIHVVDIFHEREDFMRGLFGIETETEESEWD